MAAERTVQNETDVWLLDSTRQTRFTHGANGSLARLPVWSRDGARLAFESVGSSSMTLSVKHLTDGGDAEVAVRVAGGQGALRLVTRRPSLMYYVPDPKTGTDLWVLPIGRREPSLFLRTAANELWGQFSPDGRWVAYQSNETGRYEIYVRPFAGQGGPFPDLDGRWRLSAMVSRRRRSCTSSHLTRS